MNRRGAREHFREHFGRDPVVVASAPGRVNLIGEHTDYNGGQVLPMAIRGRTQVAIAPSVATTSRAMSAQRPERGAFCVTDSQPAGAWWDYVHGALREVRALGVPVPEVDVFVDSDVPVGAGLSSSAALEVATVVAGCIAAGGTLLDLMPQVAMAAHRAESMFVGVACGTMDQTVSAFASERHALRVWCDSGRRAPVPFDGHVLIIDTCAPRSLRASAFNARRATCQSALSKVRVIDQLVQHLAHATPDMLSRAALTAQEAACARHVTTENRRVEQAVAALERGGSLGDILYASHDSLCGDYACSTSELDWVVERASRTPGVDGARLTGAGWGGCAIVLGTLDALGALAADLPAHFSEHFGRAPATWLTQAERGMDVDFAAGLSDE